MKQIIINIFLILPLFVFGQTKNHFSAGFESIAQYYVDDKKTGEFDDENQFRSNNYLAIDYTFHKFKVGIQFESYIPQALLNYSASFDKEFAVATFYAQFKSSETDALIGYFYEQFGSGLIFRSWEDRQLGLNNSLLGGRIRYKAFEYLSFSGIYGKQRIGFDLSNGQIFGLNSEIDLSPVFKTNNNINMGLSYIGRNENFERESELNETTHAYSGRINFTINNLYSNIEFIYKSLDALVEQGFIFTNKGFTGNGLLWNVGYSQKGFGIDATFRRLENMSFYTDREASGNIDNELLVNYIPSLTKQHNYNLTNIYVYQSQPQLSFFPLKKAGEIGYQVDLFYRIKKGTFLGGKYGTKIALNYSNWHGLRADFDVIERTYSSDFLKYGDKYFSDFNIEIKKKWSKKWFSILMYSNIFYSKKYIEEKLGFVNADIFIVENTYRFLNNRSTRLVLEHLSTNEDQKNWVSGLLEVNISPSFSVFANDMYNYGNDREIEKIHYYNFGGSFSKNRSRLALSYGRQRGGLICIGGVCRNVSPSTGLTINFSTSF